MCIWQENYKKISGIVLQLPIYGYLKCSIWPQMLNMTSKVKKSSKQLHVWLKDFALKNCLDIYYSFELWMFEIFYLISEVKDHSSKNLHIWSKDIKENKVTRKILYFPSHGSLKFSIWPRSSKLTPEVKGCF